MGDFFDGINFKDLVASGLDIYKTREQSKIDGRLAATRQLQADYEQSARSMVSPVVSAVADNKWQIIAGVAVVGLLAYMVMK